MPGLLNFQATLSHYVLNIFGLGTQVNGDALYNDTHSVSIKGGCDGVEATFLYIMAVLALPLVSMKEKYPALFWGVLILFVLNIFRIVGLFLANMYWPSMFEFLHLHGGVVIFTMIAVTLWLIWVNRILKKRTEKNA